MRIGAHVVRALALAAAIVCTACGKKGVPIPPPTRIPAAVQTITATRLGNDVYVTVTVPATNIDKSIPIDISRVEIYGYTGTLTPTRLRWAEVGDLVATIPVEAPPEDLRPVPRPPLPTEPMITPAGDALPGGVVTARDTLTPDEFVQGRIVIDPRAPAPLPLLAGSIPPPSVLRRFYVAIPFSRRGRPGPPGAQADLVLTAVPDPPAGVDASYTSAAISLLWEPSGGLLGFLLDRTLPPEPAPFVAAPQPVSLVPPVPDTGVPPGPTTYNVYRDLAPDPFVLAPAVRIPSWMVPLPLPLNPAPVAATSAADAPAFGRTHCYVVRTQRGPVMSEPSPRACLTPIDIFPPAPPAGLTAVPSEGGISLIWEPGGELDLGGYLVLRGEPGDATLRQLTERPIADARYRDTTVRPGQRYLYSVVAVDTQLPLPNTSAASAPVEETAR